MKKIKNSIVANNESTISNVKYTSTKFDKPSFWKGFLSGVGSSIVASFIYHFLIN